MKIHSLEVVTAPFGKPVVLHPTLIECGSEVILVDCGYAGSRDSIETQLNLYGWTIKDLTTIIITHDDIDHLGGLFELQKENSHVRVAASVTEAPFVEGKLKSLRLVQAEQAIDQLPSEMLDWALTFQRELRAIKRVPVDVSLTEGEFNDFIQVIDTPGHTPGHISLYIPSTRTMISGDALVLENGELDIANPQFTMDLDQAVESVNKLAGYQIDELHCYHGGVIRDSISERIHNLVNKYSHSHVV